MDLRILFEDHHLIAVDKPAGLATQAPVEFDSLERRVKTYIKETCNKPAGVYLGVPHRLDRPVSGVVLFCRNTKAAQRVALQFQEHTVEKTYLAIVEGLVPDDAGQWCDFLRKVPDEARTEVVAEGTPGAKPAITGFTVLQRAGEQTWLKLAPKTGRMHQLRIAAASRGFPIVGDRQYGAKTAFGIELSEDDRNRRIALHAEFLALMHPFRHTRMEIAVAPADWPPASGS